MLEENKIVITEILDRQNFLKRPKVSNISQVIFVISPKMPKLNFTLLDKELCLVEYLKINAIIVVNKTDLEEKFAEYIFNLYTKSGYKVIKTNTKDENGIENIKKVLNANTTVFAGQSGVRKINSYKQNTWGKNNKRRGNK